LVERLKEIELAKPGFFKSIHPLLLNNKNHLKLITRIRVKEVFEFEIYRTRMKAFIQFCSKFNQINIETYAMQLSSLEMLENQIENIIIKEVCDIKKYQNIGDNLI
jgi:hypothetical protein